MPELKLCVITVLCVTTIAFLISNLVTQGQVHDKMRERAIGTQSRWDTRRGAVIRQCTEGINCIAQIDACQIFPCSGQQSG